MNLHEDKNNTKEIKEIINGKIYYMGGTFTHAAVIRRLKDEFTFYFRDTGNEKCTVYSEGLNIFLDNADNKNYVSPDISIICDESKAVKRGYKGVPELIVEVLSKKTMSKDRGDKFKLYEKSGVKEYWIADYKNKSIEQYVLENGKYNPPNTVVLMDEDDFEDLTDTEKESYDHTISLTIFDNLKINLNKIFLKTDIID